MAWPTFGDLIEAVQVRLSEVPGTATNLFSEELIGAYVQDAFDLVFGKHWIPEYKVQLERTLDGTSGIATSDIADTALSAYVARWDDIQLVFPDNSDVPLRLLPSRINPFELTGTYPRYVSALNTNRLIQFWPKTSTGKVHILGRQRPIDFALTDPVKIDRPVLITHALWQAVENDSTSPGGAERYERAFKDALRDWIGNKSNIPVEMAPGSRDYPTQWTEQY